MQASKTIPALKEQVESVNSVASRLREDNDRRRADIKEHKEQIRQLEVSRRCASTEHGLMTLNTGGNMRLGPTYIHFGSGLKTVFTGQG